MLKKKTKDDEEININFLDKAVDNFFPPATANFLKEQARHFQVKEEGIVLLLNNIVCPYISPVLKLIEI